MDKGTRGREALGALGLWRACSPPASLTAAQANLPDARPLINVCDRFDMVPDLTLYLYQKNMYRYIEGYVQKVNPQKAPQVGTAMVDSVGWVWGGEGRLLHSREILHVYLGPRLLAQIELP